KGEAMLRPYPVTSDSSWLSFERFNQVTKFDVKDGGHKKAATGKYEAKTSDCRGPRGHACEGCQPPRARLRDCGKSRRGAAAVEETSKLTPDLLILDVSLPILDGPNVARRLKAQGSNTIGKGPMKTSPRYLQGAAEF